MAACRIVWSDRFEGGRQGFRSFHGLCFQLFPVELWARLSVVISLGVGSRWCQWNTVRGLICGVTWDDRDLIGLLWHPR